MPIAQTITTALQACAVIICACAIGCGGDPATQPPAAAEDNADCIVCDDAGAGGIDVPPPEDSSSGGAGDAEQEDISTAEDADEPFTLPANVAAVETILSVERVNAGTEIFVTCQLLKSDGEIVLFGDDEEPPRTFTNLSPLNSFDVDFREKILKPTRAGEALVTCNIPELGLIDSTPAKLVVDAGPPHTLFTELSRHNIGAGEQVSAGCTTFDAFGNIIRDASPRLLIDPFGEGIIVDALNVQIERADLYNITCHIDGAETEFPDIVDVSPGEPASLAVTPSPNETSYGVNQVVQLVTTVNDAFNNVITDAATEFEVVEAPESRLRQPWDTFGNGRFRLLTEGLYGIEVRVPRIGLQPLTADVILPVNSTGPSISCITPADATMINATPGSNVTVTGSVSDPNGVSEVIVNGNPATIDATGRFEAAVQTRFGINLVDIIAIDQFGEFNSRACSFLAADNWGNEQSHLNDAVTLRLSDGAFDDGVRSGGLNSIGDLLNTALNSDALLSTLDQTLLSANPLKPNSCDEESVICFGCCFRSEINYVSLSNRGTNSISIDLVNNGLRIVATLPEVWFRVRVNGTVNTTGWVKLYNIIVDLTFNVQLQNNQPAVSLRSLNRLEVNSINTDFSGASGFLIDLLSDLFSGSIQTLIKNTIRDYIQDSFDEILEGVFSGLDVNSIGTSFNVPRISGGGTIPISFGLRFSHLNINTDRALFGLGVRFTANSAHSIASLGIPIPSGSVRLDPDTGRPVAAAVNAGVLNDALHTLWRAGLFDIDLSGASLGGDIPNDAAAQIETLLPPVLNLEPQNRARIMLGGLRVRLSYPGLFDDPITLTLGASAGTGLSLDGETINFEDITINELSFSTSDLALDPTTRAIITEFLRALVQTLADEALNDALPSLPIPSFSLPDDLTSYGLPGGASLGLLSPSLSTTISNNHAVLDGSFGIQ